jgi:hypothetical protein
MKIPPRPLLLFATMSLIPAVLLTVMAPLVVDSPIAERPWGRIIAAAIGVPISIGYTAAATAGYLLLVLPLRRRLSPIPTTHMQGCSALAAVLTACLCFSGVSEALRNSALEFLHLPDPALVVVIIVLLAYLSTAIALAPLLARPRATQ